MKNKFIPEIPDSIRFEDLSTKRLVIPEGFSRPETTEEMINRILNGRLQKVDDDLYDDHDVDDFSIDDDDVDDFPEDFFEKDLPFDLQKSEEVLDEDTPSEPEEELKKDTDPVKDSQES